MNDNNYMNNNGSVDKVSKLEYNKKMLNRRVFITSGNYYGIIIQVIDDENFKIRTDGGEEYVVSCFDIRSI